MNVEKQLIKGEKAKEYSVCEDIMLVYIAVRNGRIW